MDKPKVGIIGVGFVGGAIKRYFETQNVELFVYDKFKHLGSPEEINQADIVFICTPTPFRKEQGFDATAVEESIGLLSEPKIVVIKSSVVPGTTERLQAKHPGHKVMFNPEFLREVSAYEDLIHPDRQILGVTKQSRGAAQDVMQLLPKAPYEKVLPSGEAEAVKYMANAFLALKVVFANEFYDLCRELGLDYALVKEAVVRDPRIGDSHFDVAHGGYRGYGGSCFPKDVNAIMQLALEKNVATPLLQAMRDINHRLLAGSGLNEEYFLTEQHKKEKVK